MRTYRLHYSEDLGAVQRRIEKAIWSRAERILGVGFSGPPPRAMLPTAVWAWEGLTKQSVPDGWDQYHLIINESKDLTRIDPLKFDHLIISPLNTRGEMAWINELLALDKQNITDRICFEFQPWTSDKPQGYTVVEVANFLQRLKYHFPNWMPRRRPGVEMWDARISDGFELECSSWHEKLFNFAESSPELSIVIPSYNNKYFAYNVVLHLSQQDLESKTFEVILVDDGGTDSTLEYIETFGVPAGIQLRYVYWPRPGARSRGDTFFRAGLCRNLGVRLSRGHSLVFLDSDMLVPPNFVSTVLTNLQNHDVLQFPRFHIRQEKSNSYTEYKDVLDDDLYIEEDSYWRPFFETKNWSEMKGYWKYTCTYGLALRKDYFFEAGRFCRTYVSYGFEDTELGYRLAQQQKRFCLVPLRLLHLTAYSSSEYQFSKIKRKRLLSRTAKQFFLNTLDLNCFYDLRGFMGGERSGWARFKKTVKSCIQFFDRKFRSTDSHKPTFCE